MRPAEWRSEIKTITEGSGGVLGLTGENRLTSRLAIGEQHSIKFMHFRMLFGLSFDSHT